LQAHFSGQEHKPTDSIGKKLTIKDNDEVAFLDEDNKE